MEAGVGPGHRRLAVIDFTPTGAQPMHSADGHYVMVYSGELYNFGQLRRNCSCAASPVACCHTGLNGSV
ncbi:MAG: hypothetical protein P8Y71_02550 [Pseudolabrys sp.]